MTSNLRFGSGQVFTDDRYESALFWNSICSILIISNNGNIVAANDSLCELLGFAQSELTRLNINDITYNLDSARDKEMRKDCINNDRDEYSMDKRYISKKEKVIWAKTQVQVLRNSNGAIENFIIISMPLPNGGIFKVEQDDKTGEAVVKPVFSITQLLKDDWKRALGIGLIMLFAIFDKLRDNIKLIISLLH